MSSPSETFEECWQDFCTLYEKCGSFRINESEKREMKKNNFEEHWSRIWKGKQIGHCTLYI